ncbi:MAG: DUF2089 domain-containing protein [Fusobacteriota bacterium]
MKRNKMIGSCPVCYNELTITELQCEKCKTKITGSFKMSEFDKLNDEQKYFALKFIENEGNIKKIEEDLGISYPTVKNKLKDLKSALGFKRVKPKINKAEILDKISKGEMTTEEGIKLLK